MARNYSPHQRAVLATLGATIRTLRTDQGMLAAASGVSTNYICDIEASRRNVCLLNLICIAQALNLSVIDLLKRVPVVTH